MCKYTLYVLISACWKTSKRQIWICNWYRTLTTHKNQAPCECSNLMNTIILTLHSIDYAHTLFPIKFIKSCYSSHDEPCILKLWYVRVSKSRLSHFPSSCTNFFKFVHEEQTEEHLYMPHLKSHGVAWSTRKVFKQCIWNILYFSFSIYCFFLFTNKSTTVSNQSPVSNLIW